MNIHVTATDGASGQPNEIDQPVAGRLLQRLELRARAGDLVRRIRLAQYKMEAGLLTVGEQDDLILDAAELRADTALWKAYR